MCEERSRVRDMNTLNLELWDHSKMAGWPHFPCSELLVCGQRKKSLVHTVCTCSVPPRISGNFEVFIESAPLHWLLRDMLISPVWKMPATDYALYGRCRRSDEGNKLFAYRNNTCICLFQLNAMARDWLTQSSFWSSPIVLNKGMQTVVVKLIIVSDFKTARRYLTGSITLQCSLSAGKQIISINFSSKQVTKGTLHMCERVYQVLFPPPPHKSQGTRLVANILLYTEQHIAWFSIHNHVVCNM